MEKRTGSRVKAYGALSLYKKYPAKLDSDHKNFRRINIT